MEKILEHNMQGQGKTVNRNVNNTVDNNIEDKNNHKYSTGTLITEYWDGIPYTGTIISNKGKYYKIR
jgi:hypothetical protein